MWGWRGPPLTDFKKMRKTMPLNNKGTVVKLVELFFKSGGNLNVPVLNTQLL